MHVNSKKKKENADGMDFVRCEAKIFLESPLRKDALKFSTKEELGLRERERRLQGGKSS